jgi:hypothetical protein
MFTQAQLVRLVTQGGPETRFEPRGVKSWEYEKGGYRMVLSYDIVTPECSFPAVVTVHGSEARKGGRREWFVEAQNSGPSEAEGPVRPTEFGQRMAALSREAASFFGRWQEAMGRDRVEAFLLTLREEQRKQARAALGRVSRVEAAAGGLAAQAVPTDGVADKYQNYLAGGLVESDPKAFVNTPDVEKKALAGLRSIFAARPEEGLRFEPGRSPPLRSREGKTVRFSFDFRLSDPRLGSSTEVVTLIEGDAAATDAKEHPGRWRLAGFKVTGSRAMGPPGGPGMPGGPPPGPNRP